MAKKSKVGPRDRVSPEMVEDFFITPENEPIEGRDDSAGMNAEYETVVTRVAPIDTDALEVLKRDVARNDTLYSAQSLEEIALCAAAYAQKNRRRRIDAESMESALAYQCPDAMIAEAALEDDSTILSSEEDRAKRLGLLGIADESTATEGIRSRKEVLAQMDLTTSDEGFWTPARIVAAVVAVVGILVGAFTVPFVSSGTGYIYASTIAFVAAGVAISYLVYSSASKPSDVFRERR